MLESSHSPLRRKRVPISIAAPTSPLGSTSPAGRPICPCSAVPDAGPATTAEDLALGSGGLPPLPLEVKMARSCSVSLIVGHMRLIVATPTRS